MNRWALRGLSFLSGVAATVGVWRDGESVAERRNLKAGKSCDRVMVGATVLLGPVATWITAGLDARHHWSTGIPAWAVARWRRWAALCSSGL